MRLTSEKIDHGNWMLSIIWLQMIPWKKSFKRKTAVIAPASVMAATPKGEIGLMFQTGIAITMDKFFVP